MPTTYTGFVQRAEWRWVMLVSLTLVTCALTPLLLIALAARPEANWQFMGLLHRYATTAPYLTRMEQGADGLWLVHFWYTPDAHRSALIQPIYALLGQVARFTGLPIASVFHVGRVFAAFFMYLALYHLAATIWVKVRTRRIFFIIASLGAGLGWAYALVTNSALALDFSSPQAFPFYSTLVNVHYPLSIGCVAVLAGVLIGVFRPGETHSPDVQNGGLVVTGMGLALIFLYPEMLIPLGSAGLLSTLVVWWRARRITEREVRWGMWLIIPALPVIAYYTITQRINPAVAAWVMQKTTDPPNLLLLVISLGLPLLLALPGILRAIRRFEADGDRFMLLWLGSMIVGLYLPLELTDALIGGMMLPIAYFAARAMEDFWFKFISRPARRWAYIAAVPVMAFSPLFVLLLPITPALTNQVDEAGTLLEPDYLAAFKWLRLVRPSEETVILALPGEVSVWLPVWAQARVVYGHPAETLRAAERQADAQAFYRAADPADPACARALRTAEYAVSYVVAGPRERALGPAACLENLRFRASFGQVTIYAP